jgi:hypothetical protein
MEFGGGRDEKRRKEGREGLHALGFVVHYQTSEGVVSETFDTVLVATGRHPDTRVSFQNFKINNFFLLIAF